MPLVVRAVGRIQKQQEIERAGDRATAVSRREVEDELDELDEDFDSERVGSAYRRGVSPATIAILAVPSPVLVRSTPRMLERGLRAGRKVSASQVPARIARPAAAIARTDLTPRAALWMERYGARLVTNVTETTREAVRGAVSRSLMRGAVADTATREIREIVGLTERQARSLDRVRAGLVQEGFTGEALSRRVERIREKGIAQRAENISRTECLPGDTRVSGAMVRAIHRRFYQGPMIEIITEGGRKFSATANHPMLTKRGWVAAGQLQQTDDLVCYVGKQNFSPARDQHVAGTPPTIAEIFDSLSTIWVTERRPTTQPDFHGDGMDGYVDILGSDRTLLIGRLAPISKPSIQDVLTKTEPVYARFCDFCTALLSVQEQPCCCRVSNRDTSLSDSESYSPMTNAHALGDSADALATGAVPLDDLGRIQVRPLISPGSAAGLKDGDRLASCSDTTSSSHRLDYEVDANAKLLTDLRAAEACEIEVDRVTSIKGTVFSGHVYNLTTPYGYYAISEGLITGNTFTALSQGRRDLWDELQTQGIAEKSQFERTWLTSKDERTCDLCDPLDGETVGMDEPFSTDDGDIMEPPRHSSCRCVVIIEER